MTEGLRHPPGSRRALGPIGRSWFRSTQVIGKLMDCSFDEARVRAVQRLASLGERCGLTGDIAVPGDAAFLCKFAVPLRSAEALLEALLSEAPSGPVTGLRNLSATAALLREICQAGSLADAEAILHNQFLLFGRQDYHFGDPVDWHLEPCAGRVVPRRHWSRIDFLDAAVAGDKKIVWELNRQQYLLTLGRAYARTADDRYAGAFIDHVQAWMAANPPKLGINWASALEVSYRSIAWLWALMLFRSSPRLTPQALLRILKQITLNGRHVETYLSTYFSPNTHLTGEALGLYYIGTFLPFLPEADRWRSTGRAILLQQLARQVRGDGTYFENATYYHRYTLDIYVHFAVLARGRGEPLESAALVRIEALADALAALVKPDGTHGFFGDDDGGRLLPLDCAAPNDFRPALCNAAVLFDRADFRAIAGPPAEETVWLFGPQAAAQYRDVAHGAPPSRSRALREGGLFVMRDGGGQGANHLVIDCGPHGALNCGHAHADALAFELVARGRSLLMDAGTFTYSGSRDMRRNFRSTAYHNAFTVDRASSSEPAGPFSWSSVARCGLLDWSSSDLFDVFEGEHDGFRRLADPVSYRRSLLFIKHGYWILRDRAVSAGTHDYAQHFHFSPDAAPRLVPAAVGGAAACCERTPGVAGLDIVTFAPTGAWSLEDGWVSTRYADRRPAKTAVFSAAGTASVDFVTFLLPRPADSEGSLPEPLAARAGRAFVLRDGGGRRGLDLFLIGDDAGVAAAGVASDAAWLWLRRRGGLPDSLVMSGGSRIDVDGETLFSSPSARTLVIRRDAGDLVVEGEAGGSFEIRTLGCPSIRLGGRRFEVAGRSVVRFVDGMLESAGLQRTIA